MLGMTQPMSFKQKLQQKRAILVPGAPNALAARVITDLGFEAIYVTGAGVTNMSLGLPDLSFVDLTQIGQHTMAIRRRSRSESRRLSISRSVCAARSARPIRPSSGITVRAMAAITAKWARAATKGS